MECYRALMDVGRNLPEDIGDVLRELIEAQELHFLGIVPLDVTADFKKYVAWLSERRHAEMEFLEKNISVRENPQRLLDGARCAIVVGLGYYQDDLSSESNAPKVALYAQFRDYHRELKRRLTLVAETLATQMPGGSFRVAVDTLPLLERSLAKQTARGFIGKNTCYIHSEKGSFLLLGEILTTWDLPWDRTGDQEVGCGSCTRCQVECPTGALDTDYQIDAKRCLAYWTIEHRGTIPYEFWPFLSEYYFGCDICQSVCPYNDEARNNVLPQSLKPIPLPPLFEVATMTPKSYETFFGGTPMTRAKREGLIRNALIAMTVTGDPQLRTAIECNRGAKESVIRETLEQIELFKSRSRSPEIGVTAIP